MTVQPVVLAAGKGSRLKVGGYEGPKALYPVLGRPMIFWVLEALQVLPFAEPIIVVGHQAVEVRKCLPGRRFVTQKSLRGTAKAVEVCIPHLNNHDPILVLNVDQVCVTPQGLQAVVHAFEEQSVAMTFATVTVHDFASWRSTFKQFGQVIRDVKGRIATIAEGGAVQLSHASGFELNAGIYCFSPEWLKSNISSIPEDPRTREHHLLYLAQLAVAESKVAVVSMHPETAIGVNTPRDARVGERLLEQRMERMRYEIAKFVHQERKQRRIKQLGIAPGFELSCISEGEFKNLLRQLIKTREGHGDWQKLKDPALLQGVYYEITKTR